MIVGSSDQKMILSLLDGSLLCVDIDTGTVLWSLNEDPILSMPDVDSYRLNFFPNPKDGSLYFYDRMAEKMERLPLTIPELVQISPTRSSDGLLYTATKADVWLEIDIHSGKKLSIICSDGTVSSCPASETYATSVFIARTAYTLSVYDSASKEKRWDITYLEYNSHSYSTKAHSDHLYLTSTVDGVLVAIHPLTGQEIWRVSYNSPVTALFALEDWQLRKIPIYSVGFDLLEGSLALALHANTIELKANVRKSVFVGVHQRLVYAVDCFTDENFVNADCYSFDSSALVGGSVNSLRNYEVEVPYSQNGHYFYLQASQIQYWHGQEFKNGFIIRSSTKLQADNNYRIFFDANGNMAFILIVIGSTVALFSWLIAKRKMTSRTKRASCLTLDKNEVHVGNMSYDVRHVLGHGSHGTVVFKGTFDQRPVAVKRILPECFEMADQEVNLLRDSDEHPNVIRYYCMEEDDVFKYIALELCQTTLNEYIENFDIDNYEWCSKSILHQAMKGLAHLHHLGIVHRDIKPRNVLLSYSSIGGMRALISDFGLCRKIPSNRHSYTAMSGIAGTEGWIAPEVFSEDRKVTFAADIFSMGCVIFFVITRGCHPFGPYVKRQANISSGDYVLSKLLESEKFVVEDLIKNMISHNCNFRPSCDEVLSHCLFWNESKQLNFFLDVSDRLEKEAISSALMHNIESRAKFVVGKDWRSRITSDLRMDLERFRSYNGHSVRDLLRALRNKKHHYSELPNTLKESLGDVPDHFVLYFTSRFPCLLIHVYNEMEVLKYEHIFHQYYTN